MLIVATVTGDVAKAAVPVLTFLLGYGLSYWDKVREDRRRRRNLRTILFKELRDNYHKVNRVAGAELRDPQLCADVFLSLSRVVYDAYLSKLAELDTAVLAAVLDLYDTMDRGVAESGAFKKAVSDPASHQDVRAQRAVMVAGLFGALDEKIDAAVRAFPDGNMVIKSSADERATSGRKIDEVLRTRGHHKGSGAPPTAGRNETHTASEDRASSGHPRQ